MKKLILTALLFAAVFTLPTQADFILCAGVCSGSDNADLMNGSPGQDDIDGLMGNDIIFAGDANDMVFGDPGNDLIFGQLGADTIEGDEDNDIILPGPDGPQDFQASFGEEGNDTFIVLVSETANCQYIAGNQDFDVLHLIGFGPYVAEYPYGAIGPIDDFSVFAVQDPIAGGYIFVEVEDGDGSSVERVHGLPTPDVTILDLTDFPEFATLNCDD